MSKINIQGDPSGTGTITIAAPNTNNNYTINLPTETGTLITTGATIGAASGGTGQTSLTANNVILGNGTDPVQFVAPGDSGNVLTSNGTAWVSQAAGGGGGDYAMTVFTSPGTWTKPAGLVAVKVTVIGGGGGGGNGYPGSSYGGGGGGGGSAIEYLDAPAIPGPVSVTIGSGGAGRTQFSGPVARASTGGTSSFGPFCSATGGSGGYGGNGTTVNGGGQGGNGSGGTIDIEGGSGETGFTNGSIAISGGGGGTLLAGMSNPANSTPTTPGDKTGQLYGGGGSGGYDDGGAGAGGIVVVEEFY